MLREVRGEKEERRKGKAKSREMRRIVGIRRQTIRKEEEEGEEKRREEKRREEKRRDEKSAEGTVDKLGMGRRNENGKEDKQRNGAEKKIDQTQRH